MTRRVAVALVIVIATAASAIAVVRFRNGGGPSLPTAIVAKGVFIDYLQLRGEVRPVHSTVLSAPMSGGSDLQIIRLVKTGTAVRSGDVVVQFDTTQQQRTLEQKQSELKQAESEIEKALAEQRRREQAARTALEQARSALARAKLDLEGADLRPRIEAQHFRLKASDAEETMRELEQKLASERISAAADVASARQKRDKARLDVSETERIMAGMTLRAPADGPITIMPNRRAAASVFAQSAPEFRAGDRAYFGAAIAELPDLSAIQLNCRIDEIDRARVQGAAVSLVRVDALPDRELKGSVRDISLIARPDFTQFPPTRNFDLIVALSENDPRLRSGMSATARIEVERLNGVLVVPAAAVFQRGGASTVYVVTGSEAEARRVTVLRRGRDQVAIASGVGEGDRVALKEPDGGDVRQP